MVNLDLASCGIDPGGGNAVMSPSAAELRATLGQGAGEFGVLMVEEIDDEAYPFPTKDMPDWESKARVRASVIADSQTCAAARLEQLGGTYVQSFLLINAFVANMTLDVAEEISHRSDVQSVEFSMTNTPPP